MEPQGVGDRRSRAGAAEAIATIKEYLREGPPAPGRRIGATGAPRAMRIIRAGYGRSGRRCRSAEPKEPNRGRGSGS